MHKTLQGAAIVLALVGSVGLAAAAQLNLSPAQKQSIYQSVAGEKGQPAPAGFQAKVGEKAPQSLSLHRLPGNVASQIPCCEGLRFRQASEQRCPLDQPEGRQVVEVIAHQSTTGRPYDRQKPDAAAIRPIT